MKIRIQEEDQYRIHCDISYVTEPILVIEHLLQMGYNVQQWLWKYQDETFPGGITNHEKWTFVALYPGEVPSEENIYTVVLERELQKRLKGCGLP